MKKMTPLNFKALRKTLDAKQLDFEFTHELKPLTEFLGQERAVESIHFGIGIKNHGYNMYVMGPSGIGKRSLIRNILAIQTEKEAIPSDWCYIYNFEYPEKPIPLQLPPRPRHPLRARCKKINK